MMSGGVRGVLRRLAAVLFALTLFAAAAAALAHEFDHVLHKHDAPCALHLYADHVGKSFAVHSTLALPEIGLAVAFPSTTVSFSCAQSVAYRIRAPPISF